MALTNFAADFLASPMDDSRGHIHQITNFKADNNTNTTIQLKNQIVVYQLIELLISK